MGYLGGGALGTGWGCRGRGRASAARRRRPCGRHLV